MQENCTTARREVLSILGLSAVGTLAGCTGTDNGDDDDEPDVDQGDDDPDTDDGDDAEGPSFTVAVDDIPDVEPSENVDVEVTVENTGEEHDTQPLDVMVNDDLQESKSIELDSGAETQLDVMITAPGNSGDHDVRVTTDDDEETTTLTVTDPSGSNKPINLSGTGSETREDIEINGEEPVMIEGFHDDDGDFSVTFKHPEDGPQPIIWSCLKLV